MVSLTANAISGAEDTYLQAGFDDYLTKPVLPDKLEHIIRKWHPEAVGDVDKNAVTDSDGSSRDARVDIIKKLEDIPGIDVDYGMRFYGDKSEYIESLEDFSEIYPDEEESLEDMAARMEDDWHTLSGEGEMTSGLKDAVDSFRTQVHSMKSTARYVGAPNLAGLAQLLEDKARERDIEAVLELTSYFLDEWERYGEMIVTVMRS